MVCTQKWSVTPAPKEAGGRGRVVTANPTDQNFRDNFDAIFRKPKDAQKATV